MKKTILFLSLLLFSVGLFAINFDTLGGAVSVATKDGAVIEDTVSGTASGLTADELSFINKNVSGAFKEIEVKVQNVEASGGAVQAGLLIRNGLGDGAEFLAVFVDGNNTLKIQERWYQGSFTSTRATTYISRSERIWLRIDKNDQLCPIYYKYNKNGSWIHVDNGVFMPQGGSYKVGVFSAIGSNTQAIFEYRKLKVFDPPSRIEDAQNTFSLYPNPTVDRINIGVLADEVLVYSSNGSLVLRKKQCRSVDVSSLPNGHYYIRADHHFGKFIKLQR